MKNTTKISVLAMALLIGGIGVTSAYAGNFGQRQGRLLSDEQQQVFDQIRELRQNGNYEDAQELAQDSGFGIGFRGRMGMRMENREEIRTAVENNDYGAYKELIADRPFADDIDEEVFAKIVEAHNLRMNGDYDGAREIREEIGFGFGGRGYGRGLNYMK